MSLWSYEGGVGVVAIKRRAQIQSNNVPEWKRSFFTLSPACPLFLLSLLVTKTVTYGWHVASKCRCVTQRHRQSPTTATCVDMCVCIYGPTYVCMHMYLWVCAHMYTYACMLSRWQGGSSGGMVGVKHLCGSKPRSGQLQWPMFKVNGSLRWLFISRLLHPCWTPSANRHQPSSSSRSLFSLHPQGPVLKMPVHWDPF